MVSLKYLRVEVLKTSGAKPICLELGAFSHLGVSWGGRIFKSSLAYVYLHMRVFICICIFAYAYMHVDTCVRVHVHTYMHIDLRVYIFAHAYMCMHICIIIRICINIYAYMHTNILPCARACILNILFREHTLQSYKLETVPAEQP